MIRIGTKLAAACILLMFGMVAVALALATLTAFPRAAHSQTFETPRTISALPPVTISTAPTSWSNNGSVSYPVHPVAIPGNRNGWQQAFHIPNPPPPPYPGFPTCAQSAHHAWLCPAFDYIWTPYTKSILGYSSITATIKVIASPGTAFDGRTNTDNSCLASNPPGGWPGGVQIMVQHRADDGGTGTYRFWSTPGYFSLKDTGGQTVTITAPLDPSMWIDVYGENGASAARPVAGQGATVLAGFRDTLTRIGRINLTFGAGCWMHHGLFIDNGSATFQLLGMQINP